MNGFAILLLVLTAGALLTLPRRWAPFALLVGTCYMTGGQVIEVGPLSLTVVRLLIGVGLVRTLMRRELPFGRTGALDRLMVVWTAWLLASSVFHQPASAAFVYRLGLACDTLGIFLLGRCFCQSAEDVVRLCRTIAVLLVPVAVAMLVEVLTMRNPFHFLGGVPEAPSIRSGRVRAQGPFAHAILAGTVGAVSFPLMMGLLRHFPRSASVGIVACLTMVGASASSGPVMTLVAGVGGLSLWALRKQMRFVRWIAVLLYGLLMIVMNSPPYYLMSYIDLMGGSTGWHRAALIQSSIQHVQEWWIAGTDYTRHWMPTGVTWSLDHTDLTNHYIFLGVLGGLPLVVLFVAMLGRGFALIGDYLRSGEAPSLRDQRFFWALGSSLFAHVVTFIAVAYFDQSLVFLYLTLAATECTASRANVGESVASIRVSNQNDSVVRCAGKPRPECASEY